MKYIDFLNSTLNNKNDIAWNYYNRIIDTFDILGGNRSKQFLYNYFCNGAKVGAFCLDEGFATDFINEYFSAGGKGDALSFRFDEQRQLPNLRARHTVSGFFFGLLIENCLSGVNTLRIRSFADFPFCYLWFLTYLYHDYGYCVAEREDGCGIKVPSEAPTPRCDRMNVQHCEYAALRKIKRELGIDLSIYSPKWHDGSDFNTPLSLANALAMELTKNNRNSFPRIDFSNGAVIRGKQYTSKTTTRYFNYRVSEKTVDHGIVGGYLFYDRLVKNYIASFVAALNDNGQVLDLNDFNYKGLHFGAEQIQIFSHIADCIISHNIWKQNDKNKEKYEEFMLTDLYEDKFKIISFENNPILYILSVADTLEPTKVYRDVPYHQVVEAIEVEYIPGSRMITISSNSERVDIERIHQKARSLEDWTAAKCSELKDGKFTLLI